MKFLVDECVGLGIAEWLNDQGHDAIAILAVSPGISDDAVLAKALLENRVLITMDKDFGDLIFRNDNEHCGIVLLRLENWQQKYKIAVLQNILKHHLHELENNFIVLTEQSVRIVRMHKMH